MFFLSKQINLLLTKKSVGKLKPFILKVLTCLRKNAYANKWWSGKVFSSYVCFLELYATQNQSY